MTIRKTIHGFVTLISNLVFSRDSAISQSMILPLFKIAFNIFYNACRIMSKVEDIFFFPSVSLLSSSRYLFSQYIIISDSDHHNLYLITDASVIFGCPSN